MRGPESVVVHGTGSIGMRHLRVFAGLGLRCIAMPVRASRRDDEDLRAYERAASWDEAVAKLGRSSRAPAAVIATDTSRHVADASAAISAGCDVFVEKPLAASSDGLDSLARVAREHDRRVYVACPLRFARGLRVARERLGSLGRVYSVRIECQSFLPAWRPGRDFRRSYSARASEGGVLRDLVHEVDYAVWLFGRPESVFASLANRGELGIESEESADVFWSLRDGPAVSLRLDYLSRITRRRLHIVAERGELEWNAVTSTLATTLVGEPATIEHVDQDRDEMMGDQAKGFLAALAGGDDADLVSLDEGAFAVAVLDAARESSASRASAPIQAWGGQSR